jgi:hypothetical protein
MERDRTRKPGNHRRAAHARPGRRLRSAARAAAPRPAHGRSPSSSSTRWDRTSSTPARASTCGRIRTSAWPPSPTCWMARSAPRQPRHRAGHPPRRSQLDDGREGHRPLRAHRPGRARGRLEPVRPAVLGGAAEGEGRMRPERSRTSGSQELPVLDGEGATARIIAGSYFGKRAPVPVNRRCSTSTWRCSRARACRCRPSIRSRRSTWWKARSTWAATAASAGPAAGAETRRDSHAGRANGKQGRPRDAAGRRTDGRPALPDLELRLQLGDRIEQAKEDWREMRFPHVPGETEFIPLARPAGPAGTLSLNVSTRIATSNGTPSDASARAGERFCSWASWIVDSIMRAVL